MLTGKKELIRNILRWTPYKCYVTVRKHDFMKRVELPSGWRATTKRKFKKFKPSLVSSIQGSQPDWYNTRLKQTVTWSLNCCRKLELEMSIDFLRFDVTALAVSPTPSNWPPTPLKWPKIVIFCQISCPRPK